MDKDSHTQELLTQALRGLGRTRLGKSLRTLGVLGGLSVGIGAVPHLGEMAEQVVDLGVDGVGSVYDGVQQRIERVQTRRARSRQTQPTSVPGHERSPEREVVVVHLGGERFEVEVGKRLTVGSDGALRIEPGSAAGQVEIRNEATGEAALVDPGQVVRIVPR